MPVAATIADYQQSNIADVTTGETTGSITWQAGDEVYVFGLLPDNSRTFTTPVRAGLTFSVLAGPTNSVGTARVYLWKATAAGSGSGTITATASSSGGNVLAAFVVRNSAGNGTPVSVTGSAGRTLNLTRTQDNSLVLGVCADWNANPDDVVTAVPAGTIRGAAFISGEATYFIFSWSDQGAAGGPTAYGYTGQANTVINTFMHVEIFPSALSAAVSGTAVGGITEGDIVAGGKTIVVTISGDTVIPN